MENEHVLSGLIRKRADLAGELDAAQAHARQLIIDIDAVESTIRLFAPDIDLAGQRPKSLPPWHAAVRGETSRAIYDALRHADAPLTTHDLTLRVMEARSLNIADPRLVRVMAKRVGAAMRYTRQQGRVQSAGLGGKKVGWRIAE